MYIMVSIHALKDVSLTVNSGEIVTLIGANGAGKTTTLRTISGLNKATSGEVILEGEEHYSHFQHRKEWKWDFHRFLKEEEYFLQ